MAKKDTKAPPAAAKAPERKQAAEAPETPEATAAAAEILPGLDAMTDVQLLALAVGRAVPVAVDREDLIRRIRRHLAPKLGRHRAGETLCPRCGARAVVRSSGARFGLKRYYRCPFCRHRFPLAKLQGGS